MSLEYKVTEESIFRIKMPVGTSNCGPSPPAILYRTETFS